MAENLTDIQKKQEELQHLSDSYKVDTKERDKIAASKIYNKDTLKPYELELEKLKKYYESSQEVLKLVDEWQEMWEQYKKMFYSLYEDPEKLLDYHHLLDVKKIIAKFKVEKLSKAREQLKQVLVEYEKTQGIFCVFSEIPLLVYIEYEEDEFDMEIKEFLIAKQIKIEEKTGKQLPFNITEN